MLGDRSYDKRKMGAISVEESARGLKDKRMAGTAEEKEKLDGQMVCGVVGEGWSCGHGGDGQSRPGRQQHGRGSTVQVCWTGCTTN